MRIIKKEVKQGKIRVRIENKDDLWTLKSIIEQGDTIRGSTERKIKVGSGEKTTAIRRRVTLSIAVEKSEYAADGSSLRVLGTITDGPDDVARGEHHSFILSPDEEVTIGKQAWPGYLLQKLEEARKEEKRLLVILFDREEARFFGVSKQGIAELVRLKGEVAKKGLDEQKQGSFYKEIVQQAEEYVQRGYEHVVAGAPAFWKEYLQKELPPELQKVTVVTTISAVEKTAIRELLKRPEVAKLLAESATMRELALVEKAMTALGHEKLAYGWEEVAHDVAEGNILEALVTESTIAKSREEGTFERLERILTAAEDVNAAVHVLSSDEAMGKIDPLGGLVSVKRW